MIITLPYDEYSELAIRVIAESAPGKPLKLNNKDFGTVVTATVVDKTYIEYNVELRKEVQINEDSTN